MEKFKDFTKEFLIESFESMDAFDHDLMILEKNPSDLESISSIFRVVHSIKGGCGFLAFPKLESLAHKGESVLSNLRDEKLVAGSAVVTCLFKLGDSMRQILISIQNGNSEGEEDYGELLTELASLKSDWVPEKTDVDPIPSVPPDPVNAVSALGGPPTPGEILVKIQQVTEGLAAPKNSPVAPDQTIRVDVSLLDKLMNLVGELVLVRNQVLRYSRMSGNNQLLIPSQQLDFITTELQEGVMKTRMQPIKNVWDKFPKVVRELSISCGKIVRVEMTGGDTELDKTILEAIKDPLTHVIRNSVDHGIETPEARLALGKPSEGKISLKAYHKGGQVNIEVSDDGAGIDPQKVSKKVLEKGLISPEKLGKMPDWELAHLIFLPGFSTAEKITNVSGRGVGMDVVKTRVEKIGGTVDLLNRQGQGLTLRIKIPLTLAIIPALIVETLNQRFAIPQVNVLEVVRLKKEALGKGVEWIQESPVYRLRGNLLPLVRFGRIFEKPSGEALDMGTEVQENFIVVLQADSHHFGILVHSVQDTQDIVVKPLSKHLNSDSLFAGATIMGDGKVALILDVPGLAQKSNLARDAGQDRAPESIQNQVDKGKRKESMLMVGVDFYGLIAVPMATLSRLQELASDSIETMAGMEVVQSRGKIMPLVRLGRLLQAGALAPATPAKAVMNVVVFSEGNISAGFIVDKILDIVDVLPDIDLPASRPGFRGSVIINGKATEVLDLPTFARLVLPDLFKAPSASGMEG